MYRLARGVGVSVGGLVRGPRALLPKLSDMTPKLIETEVQHEAMLSRIADLMDAAPGTPDGDELELLAGLVERYEDEAFPMDLPHPIGVTPA